MKQFFRPEAWKFVVLAMLVLVGYVVFRANEPLDFHESWSPEERQQMVECYRECCDADSSIHETNCFLFIDQHFPQNGSWVDRTCRMVYFNLESYSQPLLFGFLNKSTRSMIEETASTGNVLLKDKNDRSLLLVSLYYGFDDLAKSLVNRGADVNLLSSIEDTPLSLAAKARVAGTNDKKPISRCREMVDYLLAHGADIKSNIQVAISGVHNVEERNSTKDTEDFLCYLLEKGATQSYKAPDGRTSYLLSAAISFRMSQKVIRSLLNHGADPSKLTADEREELQKLLKDSFFKSN